MDTYWMVHCPEKSWPTKMHNSQAEADREAERLAAANPGFSYVVLRSLHYATVQAPVQFEDTVPPF